MFSVVFVCQSVQLFVEGGSQQGIFFRLDLSIPCNFKQLWFSWPGYPPLLEGPGGKDCQKDLERRAWVPPVCGKVILSVVFVCLSVCLTLCGGPEQRIFLDWIYLFHSISSNFGSAGPGTPPPHWKDQVGRLPEGLGKEGLCTPVCGKVMFSVMFVCQSVQLFVGGSSTEKLFRLDLSIPCNFKQLWFIWPGYPLPAGRTRWEGLPEGPGRSKTSKDQLEHPPPPPETDHTSAIHQLAVGGFPLKKGFLLIMLIFSSHNRQAILQSFTWRE